VAFEVGRALIPMYYLKRRKSRTKEEEARVIQYLPRMTVPTKRLRVTLVKVVNLWNTTNDSQCGSQLSQGNMYIHTHTHTHTHSAVAGKT
jgi:hypothetical protein